MFLSACAGGVVLEPWDSPVLEARKIAVAAKIDEPVDLISGGNAAEVALQASQLLFTSAQVVVLADTTDEPAILRAASIAATIGTPLLLTAPPGQNLAGQDLEEIAASQPVGAAQPGSLNTELLRLGTRALLTVGDVSLHQLDTTSLVVRPLPADDEELENILDLEVTSLPMPTTSAEVQALVRASPGEVFAVDMLGAGPAPYGTLPATLPAQRNEKLTVLTGLDRNYTAAIATAKAAGARVFAYENPLAHRDVVEHVSATPEDPVIGIGNVADNRMGMQYLVDTLRAGMLLPSGAQQVFRSEGAKVSIATVDADRALREEGVDDARAVIAQAEGRAKDAESLLQHKVVAGVDVDASRNSLEDLQYWAAETKAAGQYLFLTLKPNRISEVLTKVDKLLGAPHVGLRLDASRTGEVHVEQINTLIEALRRQARSHHLPEQILVVDAGESTDVSFVEKLTTLPTEVAVALTDAHGEEQALTALTQQPRGRIHWGVRIVRVSGQDEDEPAAYPELSDVAGRASASLLTYR